MKNAKFVTVIILGAVLMIGNFTAYAINGNTTVTNNFKPAEVSVGVVENTSSTDVVTKQEYTFTENTSSTLSVYKPVQILNVDATNSNTADAFIRVAIVPMWVTDDDTSNSFVVGAMDDIIDDEVNSKVLETQVVATTDADGNAVTDDDGNAVTSVVDVQTTYESDNNNDYLDISTFTDFTKIHIGDDNTFTIGDITFTLCDGWNDYWFFNSEDGYFYYKYVVKVGEKTTQLLQSVSIDDSKLYRYNDNPISLQVDILADSVQVVSDALTDVWGAYGIVRTTEAEVTHPYGYVLETTTTTTPKAD